MRELVLKNLISPNKKRRAIFLSESYEKEGCLQKLEKRSVCVIKDIVQITDNFDIEAYLDRKKKDGKFNPQQTYIVKTHDSKKLRDKFIYKIQKDLYTVLDNKLYVARIVQNLKVEFIQRYKK